MTRQLGSDPCDVRTLHEALRSHAVERPDERVFTFLANGEVDGSATHLTYGELDREAARIAGLLRAQRGAGQRALLLFPPGLDYIAAFLGCLRAGVIAVPAYPPDPARLARTLPRLRSIVEDSRPAFVLTTSVIRSLSGAVASDAPELLAPAWIATDEPARGGDPAAEPAAEPVHDPDAVALLQYTSGSTGAANGVILSHRNLLANIRAIGRRFGFERSGRRGVIWLPPYHDMGLIGGILAPLVWGFPVVLFSPLHFLQRPMRWLEAVSRYRATTTGGPNFAFDLCVRHATAEARDKLDLASIDTLFNGAEPIRAETLERFTAAFAPSGLRSAAFLPCYGLAEATLIVTGAPPDREPVILDADAELLRLGRLHPRAPDGKTTRLVSCGTVVPDHEVVICSPHTDCTYEPGQVGEICVRGPSISRGYWGKADDAFVVADDGSTLLRTGDLGALDDRRELFVAGRKKDLIIVRGQNHYPQDIERTVERCHPALRPGCGAAFDIGAAAPGGEAVVVVQEIDPRRAQGAEAADAARDAIAAARRAVQQDHELAATIVLVAPGAVPKTSSGKLRRRECRAAYLRGELQVLARSGPAPSGAATAAADPADATEIAARERAIAGFIIDALRSISSSLAAPLAAPLTAPPAAPPTAPPAAPPAASINDATEFAELGLDSVEMVGLSGALAAWLGRELPPLLLWEHPTVRTLAQHLAGSERTVAPYGARAAVPRAQPDDRARLSYGQERLWFLQQLVPESTAYHIAVAVRLRGQLDGAALRGALEDVVRRHESLRTTFAVAAGRPRQVIASEPALAWRTVALDGGCTLEAVMRDDAARPFDLERGPLVRVTVVEEQAPAAHVVVLTVHHIAVDGWSLAVLCRELSAHYRARVEGRRAAFPAPALQYADFAAWQRARLEGGLLQDQLAYWRRELAEVPPALTLPCDFPRRAQASVRRGAVQRFQLAPATIERGARRAQDDDTTPFVVVLAAFAVLLGRYADQDDFVVGVPVAGRGRPELEPLIGFFVNTLPLRIRLAGDLTFRGLVRRLRRTTLAALEHQDLPFERLVDELALPRATNQTPLFQVMFGFHNVPAAALELPGVAAEVIPRHHGGAQFDLSLHVEPDGAALLEYDVELFEPATIERMARHLAAVLEDALDHPDTPLARLRMMGDDERRHVTHAWNATAWSYPRAGRIHEQIQERAAGHPDRMAVTYEGRTLTYGELDRCANRLAHRLRRLGVGPDVPVAVHLERSLEHPVAVLAVHKAGGVYVPMDPADPVARTVDLLADTDAPVVVTQRASIDALRGAGARCEILCLDEAAPVCAGESEEPPAPSASEHNLFCILYTSGSTGGPKGVMLTHGSVEAYFAWLQRSYPLGEADRVLQKTPFTFDVSAWEVFWPLIAGATIVVARPGGHRDPAYLVEVAARERITVLQFVPSVLQPFVLERPGDPLASLRLLLVAGEAFPAEAERAVFARFARAELVNIYGPTETTLTSSYWTCRRDRPPDTRTVPIGVAPLNTELYVLDRHREPVPVGVPGELYIGGSGVARGYLRRPDQTAGVFVPDPFGPVPGARLYRTGDRVWRLPDGSLEFLGRIDFQVKLHGVRIELGEIEAVLRQDAAVSDAVAVVREDVPGDRRLVAYAAVKHPSDGATPGALRDALARKLPRRMVPSAVVVLDRLPVTRNGKVDRRALPAPAYAPKSGPRVLPEGDVELVIAQVWRDVLRVPQVDADDDFFELGGHSLLAAQAVARLREALGAEVSLITLFESPVLRELAGKLQAAARGAPSPPLHPARRPAELPLSFAQGRLWFLDQLTPASAQYNVAVAVRLRGALDRDALVRSLHEIARRHESLRTTFPVRDGQPRQAIAADPEIPVGSIALGGDDRLDEVLERAASVPFELERGPLVRATFIELAARDTVVLLVMHHIISDGWSMGVLVREVAAHYAAFSAGAAPALPELPVQYADYTLWQRSWLDGDRLARQLAYWKSALAVAPPVLELPTDRPRVASASHRGGQHRFVLQPALLAQLDTLGRDRGATRFMVLLAGFAALLGRYAGQDDLVVGAPIAGRPRAELEPLIGFFVNTLALRVRIAGDASFAALLDQVRTTTLEAYAHQDVPFEQVLDAVGAARSTSHAPVFQVMLALQNAPLDPLQLPGLELEEIPVPLRTANFDLTLNVRQAGSAVLEYDADLFDAATVERMANHLVGLLADAAARPDIPLSRLTVGTLAERREILGAWSALEREAVRAEDAGESILTAFEQRAANAPDALAVCFGDAALTYGELDERANQLAHVLRDRGVGPEVFAAVLLDRSIVQLVAMLGILKAGGAYVALDPRHPGEWLRLVLEELDAAVLVTERDLAPGPSPGDAAHLLLDDEWDAIARAPRHRPPRASLPESTAYATYTSGSTGRPKGVVMSHRALWYFVRAYEETLPPGRRTAQLASLSFDVSFEEIMFPLSTGGSVHIVPDDARHDIPALAELIRREEIQTFTFPVVILQQLAEHAEHSAVELSTLDTWIATGEALQITPAIRSLFKQLPGAVLYNMYGPCETQTATIFELDRDVERDVERWPTHPSIGRPMRYARSYLLDAWLEPVPAGIEGEICVGGRCVARGYVRRPDHTAERFTPDPFSAVPGARMYRTGDRARFSPDGTLQFLGRRDHQVKLRGHRIELPEIESVLGDHPAVAEVVVALHDGGAGKQLVAYVVAAAGHAARPDDLRAHVQARLPPHMVPAWFVALDAFPLTGNNKLDRKALPPPRPGDAATATGSAAGAPVEQLLAGIWADLLGRPQVGPGDHFFELGGHSLIATQLIARIRRTMNASLPVRAVFEAPTLTGLARRIEAARHGARSAGVVAPARGAGGELQALSFAQERLFFLSQLEPLSTAYHMAQAIMLEGVLDVAALARSLSVLVERHEALRTVFPIRGSGPVQDIRPAQRIELVARDLASGDPAGARAWMIEESSRPFDVTTGPLFRASLARLGPERHCLVVAIHHIVCDGWSVGIIVRELTAIYRSLTGDQPASLPDLPLRYADYSAWQRASLHGAALEAELAYWRRQLSGAPHALDLPTDVPRSPTLGARGARGAQQARGGMLEVALPAALKDGLDRLCRCEDVTLFMVLLGLFQAVIGRLANQRDVVVGTAVAGRTHPELEPIVGCFVNSLALRTTLDGEVTIAGLVRRVRETTLDAYAHQEVPFERVVDAIAPPRDLMRTPVFQVMLVLNNAPMPPLELPGLRMTPIELEIASNRIDLTLSLGPSSDGGLAGRLDYDAELFQPETMQRWFAGYRSVLEAAVADPQARVAAVTSRVLADRPAVDTNRRAVPSATLDQLFEDQVDRTPDAVAVSYDRQTLTYAELDARASHLARLLVEHGAGPDRLVGVAMERSLDLPVALIAVVKAGAAFVPLDPEYPERRLAFMSEDAGLSVVVSQSHLPVRFARCPRLDVDRLTWPARSARLARTSRPDGLAYLVYTSGSTGVPKGAGNPHRAIVNQISWMKEQFGFGAGDRALQKSPYSYDGSILDLFVPLVSGGRVVLARPGGHKDPVYLGRLISDEAITYTEFVPSMLTMFVAVVDPEKLRSLRLIICGAEALAQDIAERTRAILPWVELANIYGPSETAVQATWWRVAEPRKRQGMAIGKPVWNTNVYVVDAGLDPVPPGVAGEIVIGGLQVGRGYHRRPTLTAERFVPDPFASEPGARMYRTGDRGRWGRDGELEFLGRLDQQVQLRGFRIELDEIAAALRQHAGVAEAVVVLQDDPATGPLLVAYVVRAAGGGEANRDMAAAELRGKLLQWLPEHMVPSALVWLDALPTTPSGKLDHRALPSARGPRDPDPARPLAPARNELEERLVAVWKDLLQVGRVSVTENFFDLGGHSLLLVQLQQRLLHELGHRVELVELFRHSTIRGLATFLSRDPASSTAAVAPEDDAADDDARRLHHYRAVRRQRMKKAGGGEPS